MAALKAQISFVVFYVKDIDASREFYEKKLGFPVKETDDGYVEFKTTGVPLALMTLDAAKDLTGEAVATDKGTRPFSISLGEVADVDQAYEELRTAGVSFAKAPTTQPWGQRTAHMADPDGNLLEIYTFEKKD